MQNQRPYLIAILCPVNTQGQIIALAVRSQGSSIIKRIQLPVTVLLSTANWSPGASINFRLLKSDVTRGWSVLSRDARLRLENSNDARYAGIHFRFRGTRGTLGARAMHTLLCFPSLYFRFPPFSDEPDK